MFGSEAAVAVLGNLYKVNLALKVKGNLKKEAPLVK